MKKKEKEIPEISVIMLAYNETKLILSQAIESILNQTFTDFELIIILDNPKNKELNKLISKYEKKDKRITFIKNESNLGIANSANIGLKLAKGKYIARLDGDDIALTNRLKVQYNYLEKNSKISLVYGSAIKIDENGKKLYTTFRSNMPSFLIKYKTIKRNIISNTTIMFRKTNLLYRPKFKTGSDYDFLLRLFLKKYKFASIKRPLTKCRYRNKSITSKNRFEQIINTIIIKKFYFQKLKCNKDSYNNYEKIFENVSKKNKKILLESKIQIALRCQEFKLAKKLINKYTQKYGILNKYLIITIIFKINKKILVRV